MIKRLFVFLFILFFAFPFVSWAAEGCSGPSGCSGKSQSDCVSPCFWGTMGSGTTSQCTCTPGAVCLCNPLGSISTPQALIGRVINSILGVVGSLALLMFVYGGLTWMTSSGNQEKVKKGRDIIVWSVIGLAIIFISYALTRFVLSTVMK